MEERPGLTLAPEPSQQVSLPPHPGPLARVKATWLVSMKLLGPDVAVVTAVHGLSLEQGKLHLLRTENGGGEWKDISPISTILDGRSSNYFLFNPMHGWLMSWSWTPATHAGSSAKPKIETVFELESTIDGGATWSKTQIEIPKLKSFKDKILSGTRISLVDFLHGWWWLDAFSPGQSSVYWETTIDGGKTWNAASSSSIRPVEFRSVTPTLAWVVDDPATIRRPTVPRATTFTSPAMEQRVGRRCR